MGKVFEMIVPAINEIVKWKNGLWRVCNHNPGHERFSANMTGIIMPDGTVHLSSGKIITLEEFDFYRRQHWPMKHEDGRNPGNVTLGVRSGTMPNKGGF